MAADGKPDACAMPTTRLFRRMGTSPRRAWHYSWPWRGVRDDRGYDEAYDDTKDEQPEVITDHHARLRMRPRAGVARFAARGGGASSSTGSASTSEARSCAACTAFNLASARRARIVAQMP
jgi:hypothetical protein